MASQTINVGKDLRAERLQAAEAFRQRMTEAGTYVVRLLSSPGAGKTTLLQKTAEMLGRSHRVGILVGDVETERDAERLAPYAPSIQITTGGACHLELPLIERALPKLGSEAFDFLFVEDIGNLICPASHELGEHLRVIVLSTTEGDDKPGKYPKAFRTSQAVVLSKTDLLPYVPFSLEKAEADARLIRPDLTFFALSALRDEGITQWCDFLLHRRAAVIATANEPLQSM
ncbi:MAG: hydrogenase nickel incorporation protein HypB [Planctomycetaceae bacterium]|nr:hydrogenase nickel incorporation protein HypB [Planctomycetales bacterium]MCB9936650.1 hydrogenase nickel incorporation protein HypB [Planctomycetaceae bacterium]